jgi:hypothetical protein
MRKFFLVLLAVLLGLVILGGCVVEDESSWQRIPQQDTLYQAFEVNRHGYLRFCDSRYMSGRPRMPVIVHDPDCKKCLERKVEQ